MPQAPITTMLSVVLIPAMLPPQFFAGDENAHLDALYAALPLSRRQVVSGRYCTLLTRCLGGALCGVPLTLLSMAMRRDFEWVSALSAALAVPGLIAALLISLELPPDVA